MIKREESSIDIIKVLELLPTVGILSFTVIYTYAASLYPGGSQYDLSTTGYDWVHNYWCNLLNHQAMNGLPNPSRPYAITGMIILCSSILIFFLQFSVKQTSSRFWRFTIQICGTISMILAALIYTEYHDMMTTLSSILGLIVVIGIIIELYHSKMLPYKLSGGLLILLLGINNYIYYSHNWIEYLPLLQKITFATVLTWIASLNYTLSQKNIS